VDYLVVETTGLADPPGSLTFLGTELRDLTRPIITVVDAANYSLDLTLAAYSQIAYGDIILLNKADLVDEADLDALEVRFEILRKEREFFALRDRKCQSVDSQCRSV